jgi:hypothetical protein
MLLTTRKALLHLRTEHKCPPTGVHPGAVISAGAPLLTMAVMTGQEDVRPHVDKDEVHGTLITWLERGAVKRGGAFCMYCSRVRVTLAAPWLQLWMASSSSCHGSEAPTHVEEEGGSHRYGIALFSKEHYRTNIITLAQKNPDPEKLQQEMSVRQSGAPRVDMNRCTKKM